MSFQILSFKRFLFFLRINPFYISVIIAATVCSNEQA